MMRARIRTSTWDANSRNYMKAHKWSVKKGLNKAASEAYKTFPRAIKDTTGLSIPRAKQAIYKQNAKNNNPVSAVKTVTDRRRVVGLKHFRAVQNDKGVVLQNRFYQERKAFFKSAFIVRNAKRNPHLNGIVWRRVGKDRFPVKHPAKVLIAFDNLIRIDEETKKSGGAILGGFPHRDAPPP